MVPSREQRATSSELKTKTTVRPEREELAVEGWNIIHAELAKPLRKTY